MPLLAGADAATACFASASQAAATGGITTIICQPDTSPVIDNSATVDFVLSRARDTAIVNIHPMAALTKGLAGVEMTEIGLLKAAGAIGVIFEKIAVIIDLAEQGFRDRLIAA